MDIKRKKGILIRIMIGTTENMTDLEFNTKVTEELTAKLSELDNALNTNSSLFWKTNIYLNKV
jgi:hypothetical protein